MADPGRAGTAGPRLNAVLRRRAADDPDGEALAVAGGPSLSFGAWQRRSDAVARALVGAGVHAGSLVVLLFDNARWTDFAVAYAGVRAVGAVAVPSGPRWGAVDVARIVRRHAPVLVIGAPDLLPDSLGAPGTDVGSLEARGGPEAARAPASAASAAASSADAADAADADLLVPSGAMRPADGWWHPSPADRRTGLASMATDGPGRAVLVHAFPLGSGPGQDALLLPLRERATAVVVSTFDPDELCAESSRRDARAVGVPPFLARCLLDSGALGRHRPSSVQCVVLGPGEAPSAIAAGLARELPGVEIVDDPDCSPPTAGSGDLPDAAPLASSQDGMVWHEHFAPGSFNLAPLARRYRGRLDVGALEAALAEIVRRHDSLRARFQVVAGRCVQTFPPAGAETLAVVDLSGLGVDNQEAELARAVAAARNQPFDLVTGPLFEPRLLRLGVDDHVLLVRAHHSVFDDWSVGLFRRELSRLYTAFVAGEPSPLSDLPTSFAAACRRQREAIDGERGAADRAFWAEELRGAPLSTELPLDDPARPEGSPHRAADPLTVTVPPDVVTALRQLARRERSTLFMVLLAAFSALVHRCRDTDDVVLSSLAANRNRTELEGIIGCFAKKVLVRIRVSGDPSFTELVGRTRAALMGAMAHQDLAYEAVLQDALGPDATAHGLAPQVSLKFQSAVLPTARLSLPDVTVGPLELRERTDRPAHFLSDEGGGAGAEGPPWGCGLYSGTFLGLSVAEAEAGVSLTAEGVFHPPAVARMLAEYRTLLAAVAADPSRPVSELEVVDAEQRAEIERLSGAGARAEAPPAGTFTELLGTVVARAPDRAALVTTDRELSYAELATAAQRVAARLRSVGAGPGARVGIFLDPSPEVVVAAVATWLAGAAWVAFDGSGDQPLAAVVVREAGAGDLPGGTIPVIDFAEVNGPPDDAPPPPPPLPGREAPACVLGGGAGGPGVEVDHGDVVDLWTALQTTVYGGGELLGVHAPGLEAPGAFVRAIVALLGGHTLHFDAATTDGGTGRILDGLEKYELDVVECSPSLLAALAEAGIDEALARRRATGGPLPLVVLATTGPVPGSLWQRWRRLEGADGVCLYTPPGLPLVATAGRVADLSARPTVGPAAPNVVCRVLDRRGRVVPFQVVGELHVGRATPAAGDQASLRPVGQLARLLPDGSIELLGPASDHTDLRGFRVDLRRLETALAHCPHVADVGVAIEGGQRLVAAVVPAPGYPSPDIGCLRRFLWTQLPGYAWPARTVVVDAVPRMADGRLDPDALPDPAAGGDADDQPVDGDTRELLLRAAWSDAEGADRDADANYWQSFSFLDALTRAAGAGVPVGGSHVTRNRTVATLAADLAVEAATAPRSGPRS